MSRIKKGKYKPKNVEKYLGNPTNIIYRSGLEKRFMIFCDTNSKILQWSSEEVIIPYISPIDNRKHRYFPDFLIQTNNEWILIEVKPASQSRPPKKRLLEEMSVKQKRRYVKSVQTWLVNEAKWNAAKQYCQKKGWKFQILTEKELSPDKQK